MKKEYNGFSVDFKDKLNLCWKILRTRGYSENYTVKELLEDTF